MKDSGESLPREDEGPDEFNEEEFDEEEFDYEFDDDFEEEADEEIGELATYYTGVFPNAPPFGGGPKPDASKKSSSPFSHPHQEIMDMDDLRNQIWDYLYRLDAPQQVEIIAQELKISPEEIQRAVDDPWFDVQHGLVAIARSER